MRIFVTIAAVLGSLSCATPPATVPIGDPGATAPVAADSGAATVDTDLVCRTVARTGTKIREKQCFSRDELARMSEQSREYLRTRGARGKAFPPGTGEASEQPNKPE